MRKNVKMFSIKTLLIIASAFTANQTFALCPGERPGIHVPGTPWGVIPANTELIKGRNYFSADRSLFLTFQTDGNLVLYKRISCTPSKFKAIWDTHTSGQKGNVRNAVFQGDGNLVVYKQNGKAYWNSIAEAKKRDEHWYDHLPPYGIDSKTYTNQNGKPQLVIQNDNNLVIYGGNGRPLWDSGTAAH